MLWTGLPWRAKQIFNRAFICPSTTHEALRFCQPIVCLDVAHTKNGRLPTQLFLATVPDGNSSIFILAYAIALVENAENWSWFVDMFERSIEGMADSSLPFISYCQKGLLKAVREGIPRKVHGHCANHLWGNVKKIFGKAAETFFLQMVYEDTKK